jgi:hypothetical protein
MSSNKEREKKSAAEGHGFLILSHPVPIERVRLVTRGVRLYHLVS